jgi:hypothetical protein
MPGKPAGDREMWHFNSNLKNCATAGQAGSGRRDVGNAQGSRQNFCVNDRSEAQPTLS